MCGEGGQESWHEYYGQICTTFKKKNHKFFGPVLNEENGQVAHGNEANEKKPDAPDPDQSVWIELSDQLSILKRKTIC